MRTSVKGREKKRSKIFHLIIETCSLLNTEPQMPAQVHANVPDIGCVVCASFLTFLVHICSVVRLAILQKGFMVLDNNSNTTQSWISR